MLYLTPSTGDAGAIEIIAFRILQAVGSALFMANSSAILTDAFPVNERGKALGIHMVSFMSGQFIGFNIGRECLQSMIGGMCLLSACHLEVLGTVWSNLKL